MGNKITTTQGKHSLKQKVSARGDGKTNNSSSQRRDERNRRVNKNIRTYEISASGSGRYLGRPTLPEGFSYVEPTLFGCAHKVFDFKKPMKDDKNGENDKVTCCSIYLGPKLAASGAAYKNLVSANVGAIVNATTRVPCYHRRHQIQDEEADAKMQEKGQLEQQQEERSDASDTIKYCQVPVNDIESADILTYLEGATAFVHACLTGDCGDTDDGSDGRMTPTSVLVHCEMGMSRSSTIVIAYLMRYHNMTRDEAYIAVKKRRPLTNPNQGFWKQLEEFESWILRTQNHGAGECGQHDLISLRPRMNRNRDNRGSSSSLTAATVGTESGIICDNAVTTVPDGPAATNNCDNSLPPSVLDKNWAYRSNAAYYTCKELPSSTTIMLKLESWQHFMQQEEQIIKNAKKLSQLLFVCLDFVWGRRRDCNNVSDSDIDTDVEWMVFVFQRLEQIRRKLTSDVGHGSDGSINIYDVDNYNDDDDGTVAVVIPKKSIFELVHDMLIDENSKFHQIHSGEISEWQLQRCQKELKRAEESLIRSPTPSITTSQKG